MQRPETDNNEFMRDRSKEKKETKGDRDETKNEEKGEEMKGEEGKSNTWGRIAIIGARIGLERDRTVVSMIRGREEQYRHNREHLVCDNQNRQRPPDRAHHAVKAGVNSLCVDCGDGGSSRGDGMGESWSERLSHSDTWYSGFDNISFSMNLT